MNDRGQWTTTTTTIPHPHPKGQNTSLKRWMTRRHEHGSHDDDDDDTTTTTTTPSAVLLLDGGISTHLEQKLCQKKRTSEGSGGGGEGGGDVFSHRELWSSSLLLTEGGREDIRSAHGDFYDAGSDVVTTVTYQCSHYSCSTDDSNDGGGGGGHEDEDGGFTKEDIDGMLMRGVRTADRARRDAEAPERRRYVAASMGCYGAALADGAEYTGDYGRTVSIEDLVAFHRRRFDLFRNQTTSVDGGGEDGGVRPPLDALAFETIPCLSEVRAVLRLLREASDARAAGPNHDDDTDGPAVWVSMACRDGTRLNDGTAIAEVLDVVDGEDPEGTLVHGVGVNCVSLVHVRSLVTTITKHLLLPRSPPRAVVFYPNSGEEWDAVTQTWLEGSGCTDPHTFAEEVVGCVETVYDVCKSDGNIGGGGVVPVLVGGCCRTTPETIVQLRRAVDSFLDSAAGVGAGGGAAAVVE